ncbi:MAG: hypothetical protein COZ72_06860, partial [Elusimicrobia bacterium CG_4_8_14_3_um_filter_50_9]
MALIVISLFTSAVPTLDAWTLYLVNNGNEYTYESGPHPSGAKARTDYTNVYGSPNVLPMAMFAVGGTTDEKSNVYAPISTNEEYDCLGVFVSPPLDGYQTIATTNTFTFAAKAGGYMASYKPAVEVNVAFSCQLYLWRESWEDTKYLAISPRANEWIIKDNPFSSSMAWDGDAVVKVYEAGSAIDYANFTTPEVFMNAKSGASDTAVDAGGMNGILYINRGDRLVIEPQAYLTDQLTAEGAPESVTLYYNKSDTYLTSSDVAQLEFVPHIYRFVDTLGAEITETIGSVPPHTGSPDGNVVTRVIYGGMFSTVTAVSEIRFEGWPSISADDSVIEQWKNSFIRFQVPNITGTVKTSVYVADRGTTTQTQYLRFLPQISSWTFTGPGGLEVQEPIGANWHYDDDIATFTATVYGAGFMYNSLISFDHGGITCDNYNYDQIPGTLTCRVAVGLSAGDGQNYMRVKSAEDGIFSVRGESPDENSAEVVIAPRPIIDYFSPQMRAGGVISSITVLGSNFDSNTHAKFIIPGEEYGGIAVEQITVVSVGKLELWTNIMSTATASKNWRLILWKDNGGYADSVIDAASKLEVSEIMNITAMNISGSRPNNHIGQNASGVTVRVYGSGFETNAVDAWFGEDVDGDSVTVTAVDTYGDRVDISVTVDSNCPTGLWDLHLENENNGSSFVLLSSVTVNPMPQISTITLPVFKQMGERAQVEFNITGQDFVEEYMEFNFIYNSIPLENDEIKALLISTAGASEINATVQVYDGCTTGDVDFRVTNKDQGRSNLIEDAFRINKRPVFTSLSQTSLGQGVSGTSIKAYGSNFQNGCYLDFGNGISTTSYSFITSTAILVTVDVDDYAVTGFRDVTIYNPDEGYDTRESYLNVTNRPEVDYITPDIRAVGVTGSTITVLGNGAYFQSGIEVWFSTSGVTGYPKEPRVGTGTIYMSGNPASILELRNITIAADAPVGNYYIVTQNPDDGFAISNTAVLEISPQPTLDSELVVNGSAITNQLGKGASEIILKIYGGGFESGLGEDDIYFGVRDSSITIQSVSWKASSRIEVTVSIATNTLIGGCSVQITNPESGGSVT